MYGSQTGNAQSIAEGIHDRCKEKGLVSTLLACDGWKKARQCLYTIVVGVGRLVIGAELGPFLVLKTVGSVILVLVGGR